MSDYSANENVANDGLREVDFLWNVHGYTNEYIRFADAKAAVVLGWASAFIGVLFNAEMHHNFTHTRMSFSAPSLGTTVNAVSTLASFWLLSVAFMSSIAALTPRLWPSRPKQPLRNSFCFWKPLRAQRGLIFWGSVLEYESDEKFFDAVTKSSSSDLIRELASHVYVLSSICEQKYRRVNNAIAFALAGSVFAAAACLMR